MPRCVVCRRNIGKREPKACWVDSRGRKRHGCGSCNFAGTFDKWIDATAKRQAKGINGSDAASRSR